MKVKLFEFKVHSDERGCLVAIESLKDIPFEIKRVYYIYNLKEDQPRGFHAHRSLKQVVVCLRGSCRFLLDNGKEKLEVTLDSPGKGLLIKEMIWHEMYDFSEDCILLVLASDYYDERDYIRDYEEFRRRSNGNENVSW
jgi:dTDP-4-dehydrorhamnose 3,5-epimerase-like enzyme